MQERLWLLMTMIVIAGCTAHAQSRTGEEATVAMDKSWRLEFRVENTADNVTDQSGPSDSVQFVFRLHNESTQSREFSFTYPPHRVAVVDASGNAVWEAHEGMMFPQVMRNQTVAAGEFAEFAVTWERPRSIPPGNYRVRPDFHAFGQDGEKLALQIPPTSIHAGN